jgi:hypothetical protein
MESGTFTRQHLQLDLAWASPEVSALPPTSRNLPEKLGDLQAEAAVRDASRGAHLHLGQEVVLIRPAPCAIA